MASVYLMTFPMVNAQLVFVNIIECVTTDIISQHKESSTNANLYIQAAYLLNEALMKCFPFYIDRYSILVKQKICSQTIALHNTQKKAYTVPVLVYY